jgi:hypothetical protein
MRLTSSSPITGKLEDQGADHNDGRFWPTWAAREVVDAQCHVDKRVRGFEVAVALTEGGCWVFNGE